MCPFNRTDCRGASTRLVFVALHGRGWQVLLSPSSTGHHSGPSIVRCRVPKLTGGQTCPKGCDNPGNPGTPSRSPCLRSPPSPVLPSLGKFFPKSFRWCDFPAPMNGPAQMNGPLRSRHKARGLAFRAPYHLAPVLCPSLASSLPAIALWAVSHARSALPRSSVHWAFLLGTPALG